MKTTTHLTVAALGLALLNLSTVVLQGEDYRYVTNNGTITITKYIGTGGDVTIVARWPGDTEQQRWANVSGAITT
jgi:hypothetical protein